MLIAPRACERFHSIATLRALFTLFTSPSERGKAKGKSMETGELDLTKLTDSKVLAMLVADMEFLGLIKFVASTARDPDALKRQNVTPIQERRATSKAA